MEVTTRQSIWTDRVQLYVRTWWRHYLGRCWRWWRSWRSAVPQLLPLRRNEPESTWPRRWCRLDFRQGICHRSAHKAPTAIRYYRHFNVAYQSSTDTSWHCTSYCQTVSEADCHLRSSASLLSVVPWIRTPLGDVIWRRRPARCSALELCASFRASNRGCRMFQATATAKSGSVRLGVDAAAFGDSWFMMPVYI